MLGVVLGLSLPGCWPSIPALQLRGSVFSFSSGTSWQGAAWSENQLIASLLGQTVDGGHVLGPSPLWCPSAIFRVAFIAVLGPAWNCAFSEDYLELRLFVFSPLSVLLVGDFIIQNGPRSVSGGWSRMGLYVSKWQCLLGGAVCEQEASGTVAGD